MSRKKVGLEFIKCYFNFFHCFCYDNVKSLAGIFVSSSSLHYVDEKLVSYASFPSTIELESLTP